MKAGVTFSSQILDLVERRILRFHCCNDSALKTYKIITLIYWQRFRESRLKFGQIFPKHLQWQKTRIWRCRIKVLLPHKGRQWYIFGKLVTQWWNCLAPLKMCSLFTFLKNTLPSFFPSFGLVFQAKSVMKEQQQFDDDKTRLQILARSEMGKTV